MQSNWEVSSIRSSKKVFDFELKKNEMETLNSMNKFLRNFEFSEFKGHKHYPFDDEKEQEEMLQEGIERVKVQNEARKTPSSQDYETVQLSQFATKEVAEPASRRNKQNVGRVRTTTNRSPQDKSVVKAPAAVKGSFGSSTGRWK